MARPALPAQEQRTHSTRADLTMAEKLELTRKAALAGLSEAELIRSLIRDGRVMVKGGAIRSDPGLVTEINRLALQLKYAGVTANKLAVATHTERGFRGRWQDVAAELDAVREQVTRVLRQVV